MSWMSFSLASVKVHAGNRMAAEVEHVFKVCMHLIRQRLQCCRSWQFGSFVCAFFEILVKNSQTISIIVPFRFHHSAQCSDIIQFVLVACKMGFSAHSLASSVCSKQSSSSPRCSPALPIHYTMIEWAAKKLRMRERGRCTYTHTQRVDDNVNTMHPNRTPARRCIHVFICRINLRFTNWHSYTTYPEQRPTVSTHERHSVTNFEELVAAFLLLETGSQLLFTDESTAIRNVHT